MSNSRALQAMWKYRALKRSRFSAREARVIVHRELSKPAE